MAWDDAPLVKRIADELIATEEDFYDLQEGNARIVCLFRTGTWEKAGKPVMGTTEIVSGKLAHFLAADFLITINLEVWIDINEEARIALVDERLSQCEWATDAQGIKRMAGPDMPVWKLAGPDFSGYIGNLRRRGLWHGELRAFARNAQAFVQGDLFTGLAENDAELDKIEAAVNRELKRERVMRKADQLLQKMDSHLLPEGVDSVTISSGDFSHRISRENDTPDVQTSEGEDSPEADPTTLAAEAEASRQLPLVQSPPYPGDQVAQDAPKRTRMSKAEREQREDTLRTALAGQGYEVPLEAVVKWTVPQLTSVEAFSDALFEHAGTDNPSDLEPPECLARWLEPAEVTA